MINENILKIMQCSLLVLEGWDDKKILGDGNWASEFEVEEGFKLAQFLYKRYSKQDNQKEVAFSQE